MRMLFQYGDNFQSTWLQKVQTEIQLYKITETYIAKFWFMDVIKNI